MRIVKYIGDPRYGGEGPDQITLLGVPFTKGKGKDCIDPAVVAKAEGNSHFTVRKKKSHDPDGE